MSLLSLVLMFADSRFDYLSQLRYYAAMMVTPIHYVAVMPARLAQYLTGSVQAHADLIAENEALREQLLLQSYQLQKLKYLSAENRRLNELLNASSDVAEKVVRAQLTGESPDPFSKRVLINKGSVDEVYIRQPVIDAEGLMGQVIEVGRTNSWVLLITDPQHATPVLVDRNGARAIAWGTRDSLHMLTLSNIPNTTDIRVGDELVTSGLGQSFPAGYPVGVVSKVELDTGKPFAEVLVTPTAQIDRSRNLLLIFENREELAAEEASVSAETDEAAELAGSETAVSLQEQSSVVPTVQSSEAAVAEAANGATAYATAAAETANAETADAQSENAEAAGAPSENTETPTEEVSETEGLGTAEPPVAADTEDDVGTE